MKPVTESPYIFDTHFETFHRDVIEQSSQTPVLVDLWAEWCSPCLMIAPVLKQVIDEYDGKILLAKVEVDEGENMKIAGHNNVRGFPTILMYQDGEERARFSGAKPRHFVEQMIDQHLDISQGITD